MTPVIEAEVALVTEPPPARYTTLATVPRIVPSLTTVPALPLTPATPTPELVIVAPASFSRLPPASVTAPTRVPALVSVPATVRSPSLVSVSPAAIVFELLSVQVAPATTWYWANPVKALPRL